MYKVTKEIHFSYGHRLLNYDGKCRLLHGHNAKVEIELTSNTLDERSMVMDFVEVKQRLQKWLNDTWDHKMLMNQADPVIKQLQADKESIVTIDRNPTAEVLAQMIFDYAKAQGFPVSEVRFWETPTSFATYRSP